MWLRVAVARLSPVTGGLPGLPEQRIHVGARNGHEAVVRTLLDFVSRHGFAPFAWWRILVGTVGILVILLVSPTTPVVPTTVDPADGYGTVTAPKEGRPGSAASSEAAEAPASSANSATDSDAIGDMIRGEDLRPSE